MVGNSVNCNAEMSADIASVPSWKLQLLERKRLHDKESNVSNVSHTPSSEHLVAGDSSIPAWKRDILARKQNQKNTFCFSSAPIQIDKGRHKSNDAPPTLNNGHVHTGMGDSMLDNGIINAVVDIDVNDAIGDEPLEERLLPIHQNPILRSDLKNRYHVSSGSKRSSLSPRSTSSSTVSHAHSSTHDRASSVPSSASTQAPVTPDAAHEEVFCNDNECETEVAYGRGFVHKLLMKFSHLNSSSSDHTSNNRYSKSRTSTSSDGSKLSSSGSRRKSSQDLESIPSKPSSGMPTAKFHSVDDLLHETKFQVRVDRSESADDLDSCATNGVAGEVDMHEEHGYSTTEDDVIVPAKNSSAETHDELPIANTVASARSLFESLAVHTSSHKSASPSAGQNTVPFHFSHSGTLERSHQPKSTSSTTKTSLSELGPAKKLDLSHDHLKESGTLGKVFISNGPGFVNHDGEHFKSADASTNHAAQESNITGASVSAALPPHSPSSTRVNSGTHGGSSDSDRNFLQSYSKCSGSPSAEGSQIIPTASTAHTKSAVEDSPPSTNEKSWTVHNTSADVPKPVLTPNFSASSQLADSRETLKTVPEVSGKKPAPSRPGKLVIRPASNLVASKTSSEYLDLTKFNDVRKGEFAPPVKKERTAADSYEDEVDKADEVTSESLVTEEYVFDGAGVIIGRSLLTKTNKNRLILFDDSLTETFEYPSEQSLMAATPAQPGDVDYEGDMVHTTGLLVTPSIVNAGALSSYQSRTQVDYQFGMHLKEERKPPPPVPSNPPPPFPSSSPSTVPETTSWSKNATSDLLF